MGYLSNKVRNQRWCQVIDTILMPYLIIPVFLETFHIHERKFKVTNKTKTHDREWFTKLLYALPHIVLLLLSIAALVRYTYGKYGMALFHSSVIIFWLVYNLSALCYAVFFMLGRRAYRNAERIAASEEVTIYTNEIHQQYHGRTIDVSDHGIAIYMDMPVYIPLESDVKIHVRTHRYQAILNAEIVYVKPEGKGWRYSAKVEPVSEQDKREYMQTIYDRKHSLPEQLDLWNTDYDDITRNIKKRMEKSIQHKRKYPRVQLDYPVVFTNGVKGRLKSFNFKFFSISDLEGIVLTGDRLVFYTSSNIEVMIEFTMTRAAKSGEYLCKVVNLDELTRNHLVEKMLEDLSVSVPEEMAEIPQEAVSITEPVMPAIREVAATHELVNIKLNCPIQFTNGTTCILISFEDSAFVVTKVRGWFTLDEELTFYTDSQIKVVLKFMGKSASYRNASLFKIVNMGELQSHGLIGQMLEDVLRASSNNDIMTTRRELYAWNRS